MKDRRAFAHEIKAKVYEAIRQDLGDAEAAVLASQLAGDVYTLAQQRVFPGQMPPAVEAAEPKLTHAAVMAGRVS